MYQLAIGEGPSGKRMYHGSAQRIVSGQGLENWKFWQSRHHSECCKRIDWAQAGMSAEEANWRMRKCPSNTPKHGDGTGVKRD